MITIDTREPLEYSPLIPALKAFYTSPKGAKLDIIMDNESAFHDFKTYLSAQKIVFSEIYECYRMMIPVTFPN